MSNHEFFSFSNTSDGVTTTVSFSGSTEGTTVYTFQDMCKRAAMAFGYMDSSVEDAFGETNGESFAEFHDNDDEE